MHSLWKYKNGFRKLRNVFRLVQLKTKSKTETVSETKPNALSCFQNKGISAWDPQHRLYYSLCGNKYC